MTGPARLLALTTAVPSYELHQPQVGTHARRIFLDNGNDITRLLPVYDNAGIQTRYASVPLRWFGEPHGWKERSALFRDHAVTLLRRAAESCLKQAGLAATAVDAIVAVTTSGMATPSLEARLMNEMPFRQDVQRLPIVGLGCAGGVLGLARAAAMARAAPGSNVLLLVVELCSLTFRNSDTSKSNVVATALFGDGAAAALISCRGDREAPEIAGWGEHLWPESLDVMGWLVEDDGFGVLFSRDIPSLVRHEYRAAVDAFLAGQGLTRADLAGAVCHPGGAKVLDALQAALDLPDEAMSAARHVLRHYGNMSAATVLFVLEKAIADGLHGRHLVSSLGPGFTAGFVLLEAP